MTETRDITQYTQDYLKHNFEEVIVKYRRKTAIDVLNQYRPRKILEIGCGLNSIINDYNSCDRFVIVEPSKCFAAKAKEDIDKLNPPPREN